MTVETAPLPITRDRSVILAIDGEPVNSSSIWLRHKTTRRDAYRVCSDRHPNAEQVVLVNERAEVAETTVANLAVWIDGTWWTLPTTSACLLGVERGRQLEVGRCANASWARRTSGQLRGWLSSARFEACDRPCSSPTAEQMTAPDPHGVPVGLWGSRTLSWGLTSGFRPLVCTR